MMRFRLSARAQSAAGRASAGVDLIRAGGDAVAVVERVRRDHRCDACDSRRPRRRPFWKRRLIAMVMTLGMAAILISAMLTVVVWPQILSWLGLSQPAAIIITIVHAIVVTVTVYATLALGLLVGCHANAACRRIGPGCAIGTVGVVGASVLLRIYAQNWADYGATYGSLAGIMLLMSWLWMGTVAFLAGAVLNRVIEDALREAKPAEQTDCPTAGSLAGGGLRHDSQCGF